MKVFQEGMTKQIFNMLKAHLYTIGVGTFLGFLFMNIAPMGSIAFRIFAILFLLVYVLAIYLKAWECAEYDKKSYTTTSTYILKGAVLSIGILILNYVLYAFYLFSWNFLVIDGALASTTGTIYNILYVIDTFVYAEFVEITQGIVSWQAHLMIVFVPMLASLLGYIAGVKGLVISEKFMPFIYEKKKKGK